MNLLYKGYDKERKEYLWVTENKAYTVKYSEFHALAIVKEYSVWNSMSLPKWKTYRETSGFGLNSNSALKYLARYLGKQ